MASQSLSELGIPTSASANQHDFRVLIDTFAGKTISYFTSSYIDVSQITTLSSSNALERVGSMDSCSYYNGTNFRTHPSQSLYYPLGQKFKNSVNPMTASVSGSEQSGSLVFHQKVVADPVKRYKFFGTQVCNVFGIPEDIWLYTDEFRLATKPNESNFIKGNIIADQLQVMRRINFSNISTVNSDLSFRIDSASQADTSRYIKFVDYSGPYPKNKLFFGYEPSSSNASKYVLKPKWSTAESQRIIDDSTDPHTFQIEANEFILGRNWESDTEPMTGSYDFPLTLYGNMSASGYIKAGNYRGRSANSGKMSPATDGISFYGSGSQAVLQLQSLLFETNPTRIMKLDTHHWNYITAASCSKYTYFMSSSGEIGLNATSSEGVKLTVGGNISSSGNFYNEGRMAIGRNTVTPEKLTIEGNISASGDLYVGGGKIVFSGSQAHISSSYISYTDPNMFVRSKFTTYFGDDEGYHMLLNRGKMAIGRNLDHNIPRTLQVEGSISASGHLYFENRWHMGYYGGGFNLAETGVADYRIFVQTGSGNVGIGNSKPSSSLTVTGDISASGELNTGRHMPDYDSGWFAVSNNQEYTKTLPWTFTTSTLPRVRIFISDDATPVLGTDYIDEVRQAQYYYSAKGMGVYVSYSDDDEITLHTGWNYVYYRNTAGGSLSGATFQTSGYLLVQAWK